MSTPNKYDSQGRLYSAANPRPQSSARLIYGASNTNPWGTRQPYAPGRNKEKRRLRAQRAIIRASLKAATGA